MNGGGGIQDECSEYLSPSRGGQHLASDELSDCDQISPPPQIDTSRFERVDARRGAGEARLEAGLTQVQVAKKLRSPQSNISNVENGQQRVDVVELRRFASIYKKDINYLL